jgi:hypothetical protein
VHPKLAVFQIGRQHNEPIFHVVSDGRYPEPTFKLIYRSIEKLNFPGLPDRQTNAGLIG